MSPVISRMLKWCRNTVLRALVSMVCIGVAASWSAAAPNPLDVVKTGTDQVLGILKQASGRGTKHREEIRKVVDGYFDFNEMARRAVGPHWNQQPPEKQTEFVSEFSRFLFNVYIDKVEKYTNETINYRAKDVSGNYATVDTVVTGGKIEGGIPIAYRLLLRDGQWKVYDVIIEGVSLVSNYRSQFNSILASRSFDGLLKDLHQKNNR